LKKLNLFSQRQNKMYDSETLSLSLKNWMRANKKVFFLKSKSNFSFINLPDEAETCISSEIFFSSHFVSSFDKLRQSLLHKIKAGNFKFKNGQKEIDVKNNKKNVSKFSKWKIQSKIVVLYHKHYSLYLTFFRMF